MAATAELDLALLVSLADEHPVVSIPADVVQALVARLEAAEDVCHAVTIARPAITEAGRSFAAVRKRPWMAISVAHTAWQALFPDEEQT